MSVPLSDTYMYPYFLPFLSRFLTFSLPRHTHTHQELDIIYKIPHTVPISAHHKWNFDDLLEKMWEYLNLVRM